MRRNSTDAGGKMNPVVRVIYDNAVDENGESVWLVSGVTMRGHSIDFGLHDIMPSFNTLRARFDVVINASAAIDGGMVRDAEEHQLLRYGSVRRTVFSAAEKQRYYAELVNKHRSAEQ